MQDAIIMWAKWRDTSMVTQQKQRPSVRHRSKTLRRKDFICTLSTKCSIASMETLEAQLFGLHSKSIKISGTFRKQQNIFKYSMKSNIYHHRLITLKFTTLLKRTSKHCVSMTGSGLTLGVLEPKHPMETGKPPPRASHLWKLNSPSCFYYRRPPSVWQDISTVTSARRLLLIQALHGSLSTVS